MKISIDPIPEVKTCVFSVGLLAPGSIYLFLPSQINSSGIINVRHRLQRRVRGLSSVTCCLFPVILKKRGTEKLYVVSTN